MSNNPYDDSSSGTLPKVAGTITAAGVAFGGYKLMGDDKGTFKKTLSNVWNKVYPEKTIDGNAYDAIVDRMKESTANTSSTKRVRFNANAQRRRKDNLKNKTRYTGSHISMTKSNPSSLSKIQKIGINSLDEVLDVKGNPIGHKIFDRMKDTLGKHGMKFSEDPVFSGNDTTGLFKYTDEKGAAGELKIKFGQFNDKSGGWLSKGGDATYMIPKSANVIQKEGALHGVVMDPNTAWFDFFKDQETIAYHGARHKEYDSGSELLSRIGQGNEGKDVLKRVSESAKSERALEKVNMKRLVKYGIDKQEEAHQYVAGNNLMEMKRAAGQVQINPYSLHQLESVKPGISSNGIGVNNGAELTGSDAKIVGANIAEVYGITGDRLTVGSIDGNDIKSTSIADMAKEVKPNQLSSVEDLAYFGFTPSQGQVYEKMGLAARTNVSPTTEAFKSEWGNLYTTHPAEQRIPSLPGLSDDALRGIRSVPNVVNPDIVRAGEQGMAGFYNATVNGGGIINTIAQLNPTGPEIMSFTKDFAKKMEIRSPDSLKLRNLIDGGEDLEKSKVDFWIAGNKETHHLHEIYSDKDLQERFLASEDNVIKMDGRTAVGYRDRQISSNDADEIKAAMKSDGEMAFLKADAEMTPEHVRMGLDLNDGRTAEDGTLMFFDYITPGTKPSVINTQIRSTMHEGIDKTVQAIAKSSTGFSTEAEISTQMFEKSWPLMKGGKIVQQKGAAQYLGMLQEMMVGNIHKLASVDQDVIMTGSVADTLRGHLAFPEGSGDINVTDLYKSGKLKLTQHFADPVKYGHQMEDSMAMLSNIKDFFQHSKQGNLTITPEMMADKGELSQRLVSNIDLGEAAHLKIQEEVEEAALHKRSYNIDPLEARLADNPINIGIAQVEKTITAQGAKPFNSYKISMRDMKLHMDRPEIMKELLLESSVDMEKRVREIKLFELANSGEEGQKALPSAIEAYDVFAEEAGYPKINMIKNRDDVVSLMGGEAAVRKGTSGLQESEIVAGSFMTNQSPSAMMTEDGGMQIVMSGPTHGGVTVLTKDGKTTVPEMANKTFSMLLEPAIHNGGVIPNAANKEFGGISSVMLHDVIEQTALKMDTALYSRNVADRDFLHSWGMGKFNNADRIATAPVGEQRLNKFFGNTAVVSAGDYQAQYHQKISDAINESSISGEKASSILERTYEGNASFAPHYKAIDAISAGEEGIGAIAHKITTKQEGMYKELQSYLADFNKVREEKTATAEALRYELTAKMQDIYDNGASYGLVSRNPKISAESDAPKAIFPSSTFDQPKMISVGDIASINKNADNDGDKLNSLNKESKGARAEAMLSIDKNQSKAYQFLKEYKDKKVLKALMEMDGGKIAAVSGSQAQALAHSIHDHQAIDTALNAFSTKGMTGSLNVAAAGVKSFIDDMIFKSKDLSDDERATAYAWGRTMPSRMLEQEVISSKHLNRLLLENGETEGGTDAVMRLIGKVKPDDIRKVIQEMDGTVHPSILAAVTKSRNTKGLGAEWKDLADNVDHFMDITQGLRRKTDAQFTASWQNIMQSSDEATARKLEIYKKLEFNPVFEDNALKSIVGNMGMTEILGKGMNGLEGGKASSENLHRVYNDAATELNRRPGSVEPTSAEISELTNRKLVSSAQNELLMDVMDPLKTAAKQRRPLGWGKLKEFGNWLIDTEGGKVPKRLLGLGAITMGAVAAINLLSGDGTPQTPNDLPSLNNPSFSSHSSGSGNRSTVMAGQGYNTSIGLLTDNTTSFSSAQGQINSVVGAGGYSSVSVRHDGTDPYKSDMFKYTGR